jgi:hypothetical protein
MIGGSCPGRGWEIFPHPHVQTGAGTHPASYPVSTRGSFRGGKAAGREADHSPQSSAEAKNVWSCTSTPQYTFMVWCPVKKAQGQLYLLVVRKVFGITAHSYVEELSIITTFLRIVICMTSGTRSGNRKFRHKFGDIQIVGIFSPKLRSFLEFSIFLTEKDCLELSRRSSDWMLPPPPPTSALLPWQCVLQYRTCSPSKSYFGTMGNGPIFYTAIVLI